jgi:hypothetical protein
LLQHWQKQHTRAQLSSLDLGVYRLALCGGAGGGGGAGVYVLIGMPRTVFCMTLSQSLRSRCVIA